MGLKENLAAAQAAVDYVKKLGILAINKSSDRIAASGGIDKVIGTGQGSGALSRMSATATTSQFQLASGPLATSFLRSRYGGTTGDTFRDDVARYIKEKAGNCDEQASIALLHLFDNSAGRPLSKMAFTANGYDHVWVVIGLEPGWDDLTPPNNAQNLRNWGPDAVWCDPWQGDGVAFSVQSFVRGEVRNLNAIYKCNTAERVAEGKPIEILRVGP